MKKLFILVAMLFAISLSYGQTDTTVKEEPGIMERVTTGVKNTTTKVDTGSLYKQIYGDVKTGLKAVAEGLKVGVEHVYIVLVKQQIVKSIVWTILFIAGFISIFNWFKSYKSKEEWVDGDFPTLLGAIRFLQVILTAILIVGCFTQLDVIVTGFVNPEYGALEEIVEFVGKAKGNSN